MQDEITSDLARLADLKVVGSQSTGSYVPSKERDLRAIGRDLGVRYLLEGDVWRANSEPEARRRRLSLRGCQNFVPKEISRHVKCRSSKA
jgi:hypothetical protein